MATADETTDDLADDDERWQGIRAAVKAARALDEEPPARLDALLMAAARQHAPSPRPGALERLRRWLAVTMLQPAVAGATALAVIGGTAGVLYLRNHGELAQPTVSHTAPAGTPAEGPVAAWSGSAAGGGTAPARPSVAPLFPDIGADPVTTGSAMAGAPGDLHDLAEHQERADPLRRQGGGRSVESRDPEPKGGSGSGGVDHGEAALGDDEVRDSTGLVGGVVTTMPLTLETPPPPDTGELEKKPVEETSVDKKPATEGGADKLEDERGGGAVATVTSDSVTIATDQESPKAGTQAAKQRQAENLLRQARTAARKKNCATVKVMAKRAKVLDPAYYTSTFARDAAVKPCL